MFRTVCPLAIFHQGGGLFRKAKHFALRTISSHGLVEVDCAFLNSRKLINYLVVCKKKKKATVARAIGIQGIVEAMKTQTRV